MKNMKKILAIITIFSLIFAVGCTAKKAEDNGYIPVEVTRVSDTTMHEYYTLNGLLQAINKADIVPKIPGKVVAVYKNVGDSVSKGEILCSLDKSDYYNALTQLQAQIEQAKGGTSVAENNQERTLGTAKTQALTMSKSQLDQAKVGFDRAQTDFLNNQTLFNAGAISKYVYDASKSNYDNASIAYETAKTNYEVALKSVDENSNTAGLQVNQAKANEKVLRAQIASINQKIADCDIKSPFKGLVAAKTVNVGEMASTQMPSYTIVDNSKVTAEVSVSENMINKISKGLECKVKIASIGNREFTGSVDSIAPSSNGSAGYLTKILIDNAQSEIKPGMFCEVNFFLSQKQAKALKYEAIVMEDELSYIFVVNGDTVSKVKVTTGIKEGALIEVLDAPSNVDIITKGQNNLKEGSKIKIIGNN